MRLTRVRLCILCAALAALSAWLVLSVPIARAQDKPVSFINDVAPILKENCFACHDAKKRSGKFDMTTFEKFMAGGADGEAITAGKHKDSDLYRVDRFEKERRMPPRKDNLSPRSEATDGSDPKWIDQGAKLDAGIDPKADLVKELRIRWKSPPPPTKYPYPDDHQLARLHARRQATRRQRPSRIDCLGCRNPASCSSASTRGPSALMPWPFCPMASWRSPAAGRDRKATFASSTSTAPGKKEGDVQILDGVNDPKVMLKQLLDTDDSVLCLAVSVDGKQIAAGGCDRTVRVWDYPSYKLEQSIENHADWVLGVAFTPDGKHLLTCSRDKTAKVWDLVAKESVLTFPDHQQPVFGVGVKADGKVGFSAGVDKQLRMWNATGEGKQIKVLGGHSRRHPEDRSASEDADHGDDLGRQDGESLGHEHRQEHEDADRPERFRLRGSDQPGRQGSRRGWL